MLLRPTRCIQALLLALSLSGCGGSPDGPEDSPLAGPPVWWAARESLSERSHAIHVRAGSACGVGLVVEGVAEGRVALPLRQLAAGETVRIWWAPDDRDPGQASPEDAEQGYTEPLFGGLAYGFGDAGSMSASIPLWARPGRGQEQRASVLPPPKPEPLPLDEEIELAVVVVADLDPGETLLLRPRAGRHVVLPDPKTLALPERARVLRFRLVVRPGTGP